MNTGLLRRRSAPWQALAWLLIFCPWTLCPAAPAKTPRTKATPEKPAAKKTAETKPKELPIPGPPAGNMATELFQARAWVRAMEYMLAKVTKDFPAIAKDAVMANATWRTSAFAKGGDVIDAGIRSGAGKADAARLKKMDEEMLATLKVFGDIKTEEEASDFLDTVIKRSKGDIEVPMVRGILLWQNPAYQENPDKEFRDGFRLPLEHTAEDGAKVEFKMPMSWKESNTLGKKGANYVAGWGHGGVSITVILQPMKGPGGLVLPAEEVFAEMTQESVREQIAAAGATIKDFSKTKVNNMPALMFTQEQMYEQLGKKMKLAMRVVMAFRGTHSAHIQLTAVAPGAEGDAAARLTKYLPLFELVAGTLMMERESPEEMAKAREAMKKAGAALPADELLKEVRASAEKGDAEAQAVLGAMYAEGKGVPQDDRKAVQWLQKAADQGLVEAQYTLGSYHAEGGGGLKKSDSEALKWWRRAADGGYAEAQHNVGVCYRDAVGVEQDYAAAVKWFQKSADQGLAAGQLNLGLLLGAGRGVTANPAKGLEWVLKAAHQDLAEAQAAAGMFYMSGEKGLTLEPVRAHAWLTIAVANGCKEGAAFMDTLEPSLTSAEKTASAKLVRELKGKIVKPAE